MANKNKTHKATAKRFKVTKKGRVQHLPQGGGNGHSRNYMNSSQKHAKSGENTLSSTVETNKILRLLGK